MAIPSKSMNARLGHIKRRIAAGEPLTRDLLELALSIVGNGDTGDELIDGIANKLMSGEKLGDYELHVLVDVYLLHAKLGNAAACRQK